MLTGVLGQRFAVDEDEDEHEKDKVQKTGMRTIHTSVRSPFQGRYFPRPVGMLWLMLLGGGRVPGMIQERVSQVGFILCKSCTTSHNGRLGSK